MLAVSGFEGDIQTPIGDEDGEGPAGPGPLPFVIGPNTVLTTGDPSVGDGHRIIYGVAGSGKTVILIARAKMVAEDRSKKVLLLCYNKALRDNFRVVFAGYANVKVGYFHGWASAFGIGFNQSEPEEDFGERLLGQLRGCGVDQRYDAVFVDEAQDFARSWFQCAKEGLKEPEDGDLVIVGDGNQSLYRRRTFTWAAAGVMAVGRTINTRFDLDKNYRNTREVLRLAEKFAGTPAEGHEDVPLPPMVASADQFARSGPAPLIKQSNRLATDLGAVLNSLRDEGVTADQIAVLYRANSGGWVEQLAEALSRSFPIVWRQAPDRLAHMRQGSGICLTTLHSSKGLQWKVVIILKPELLPFIHPAEQQRVDQLRLTDSVEADRERQDLVQRERGLMYVALTRAEDRLLVLYETPVGFADELQQATHACAGAV